MSDRHDRGVSRRAAMHLIILFGFVSLFGDIVYEGARSVNGPYLETLGASAATVGLIAGAGEFVGYAVRLFSGYFADRTRTYWLFTFLGYGALISVPLLSLAGAWQLAALFIVLERFGKALRAPAKDTIMSQVSKQVGTGVVFGLHEAMDQIGAIAGPLIFTGLFLATGAGGKGATDYQLGYRLLWIPYALVMLCLVVAYLRVSDPERFESAALSGGAERFARVFHRYNVFTAATTLGFVNVMLLTFHFKRWNIVADAHIPLLYAVAMGVDGAAAVLIGLWYDRLKATANDERAGVRVLAAVPVLSAVVPVLAFTRSSLLGTAAMVLWGITVGAHETVMRSAIADLTPVHQRGTGYGVYNVTYGVSAALGTAICGLLYEVSPTAAVVYCVAMQAAALVAFQSLRSAAARESRCDVLAVNSRGEHSAGGLVVRGFDVLVIRVRNLEGKTVVTFPKGHLEPGETPERAAVREVREETGIEARITGRLPDTEYEFVKNGVRVQKRVSWFTMEPVGETDPTRVAKTAETETAYWLRMSDAESRLSYPLDRELLRLVKGDRHGSR